MSEIAQATSLRSFVETSLLGQPDCTWEIPQCSRGRNCVVHLVDLRTQAPMMAIGLSLLLGGPEITADQAAKRPAIHPSESQSGRSLVRSRLEVHAHVSSARQLQTLTYQLMAA